MATNVVQKNKDEKKPISVIISEFLMKNRKIILSVIAVLSAILIAVVVYFIVIERKNTTATARIESLMEDWEKAKTEEEGQTLTESEDRLLEELSVIAARNKRLSSGARANLVAAEIYYGREDWKNAREHYLDCIKAEEDIYTAAVAYYNAAVCSEELGEMDAAIDQYNKAYAHESFSQKSRALFNIGRIEEQRGNRDLAITSYEKLAEEYPEDTWALLAKSRILALQIQ